MMPIFRTIRGVAGLQRRLCTGLNGSSAALKGISDRATELWDDLMFMEWIDEPDLDIQTEKVTKLVDDYRNLYSDTEVDAGGQALDVYRQVEKLYQAGEAVKITTLYANYIDDIVERHGEMRGELGNHVQISDEEAAPATQTLHEYFDFVNCIENQRLRRKTEAQLGRKAVQLRQMLSVDGFSYKFGPVAGDHLVSTMKKKPELDKA